MATRTAVGSWSFTVQGHLPAGAPPYELPVVVQIGQFLHRSPTVAMAVKGADGFSTGCLLDVPWAIRRGSQTDEEWAELNEPFFRPGPRSRRGAAGTSMLLFGVAFPDGSKSSTGAHPHGFFEGTEEPDPPVLLMRNGGDDELAGSVTPLPACRNSGEPAGPQTAPRRPGGRCGKESPPMTGAPEEECADTSRRDLRLPGTGFCLSHQ